MNEISKRGMPYASIDLDKATRRSLARAGYTSVQRFGADVPAPRPYLIGLGEEARRQRNERIMTAFLIGFAGVSCIGAAVLGWIAVAGLITRMATY